MKNVLIFAGLAGIAAAIAIYFVTEADKDAGEQLDDTTGTSRGVLNEPIGRAKGKSRKGFHAMG